MAVLCRSCAASTQARSSVATGTLWLWCFMAQNRAKIPATHLNTSMCITTLMNPVSSLNTYLVKVSALIKKTQVLTFLNSISKYSFKVMQLKIVAACWNALISLDNKQILQLQCAGFHTKRTGIPFYIFPAKQKKNPLLFA